MINETDRRQAVIVLPAAAGGLLRERSLRRWLSRGDVDFAAEPGPMHARVRAAAGLPPSDHGAAALRFWGATGDRPATWMAAADPVFLEARMNHVRLHRLWPDELEATEARALFERLHATLAEEGRTGFAWLGGAGYLRAARPMPTAVLPPSELDGREPGDHLPAGPAAAAYQRLASEVQMTLHDAPVNESRRARGLRPVNALWIWGGGVAGEPVPTPVPSLFADDALLRGCWFAAAGRAADWPGSLDACADRAPAGFVAEVPDERTPIDEHTARLETLLAEARALLAGGAVPRMVLLARDGLTVTLERRHLWRVWRRDAAALDAGAAT